VSSATADRSCRAFAGRWLSARRRAAAASRIRVRRLGGGCGKTVSDVLGAPSTRLARTARPPMPSARTWCSVTTRAAPPPASEVINVADHRGRFLASLRDMLSATTPSIAV
jgi:hypothetical protein